MAVDTFMVYVGVYPDVAAAEADYDLVKDLHTKAGLIDAYDAAVVERRASGKTKIVKKHETPTRVGGVLGGGFGLPPAWSSRCSRSPPSGAVCWRRPRPAAPRWGRWPVTRRPG